MTVPLRGAGGKEPDIKGKKLFSSLKKTFNLERGEGEAIKRNFFCGFSYQLMFPTNSRNR